EPGPRPLPAGEHRVLLTPEGDGGAGRPVRHRDVEMEGVDCLDLRIPRDYPVLRERDPELGMAWRGAVAESFEACFARGMIAANYQRRESVYHLVPPERAHLDWPER